MKKYNSFLALLTSMFLFSLMGCALENVEDTSVTFYLDMGNSSDEEIHIFYDVYYLTEEGTVYILQEDFDASNKISPGEKRTGKVTLPDFYSSYDKERKDYYLNVWAGRNGQLRGSLVDLLINVTSAHVIWDGKKLNKI